MAEANQSDAASAGASNKGGGKKKLILLIAAPLLLLGGGGGAAYAFVPAVHGMIAGLLGHGAPAEGGAKTETAEAVQSYFVQIPEMTVTMPNGGRTRQLRIKIALELAKHPKEGAESSDILSPRINDGLVLYLRTLRDADVDGALSIDRMRGDLQRRLDLLLGDGVLRDVLITSLIIG